MSETNSERKRKRIVEYRIAGFNNAPEAIKFGNTVEHQLECKAKFRQQVGSPNTCLAITESWQEATTLKMTFMEIDHNDAHHIIEKVKRLTEIHSKINSPIEIEQQLIREKPQPQSIGT